jgi:HlyD family secretion protein
VLLCDEPTGAARPRPGPSSRALAACVRRIDPQAFTKVSALGVEEQPVQVALDLLDSPESWSRLGDDYRVPVRFEAWRGDEVVAHPRRELAEGQRARRAAGE